MNAQSHATPGANPAESFLASILNAIRDPVISVDDLNRVLFLNRAAAERFGCSIADALGHPAEEYPHLLETINQLNLKELRSAPGPSRATGMRDLRIPHAQREPSWVRASVNVLESSAGRCFVVVLQDLSQQRQDELVLNRAQQSQAIAALAGGVAHDFNNVFTAILSHLDLVWYAPELPASLKEYVTHAQHSARRGADLVSRLTSFGHRPKPVLAPLDLGQMLRGVIISLQPDLPPSIHIRLPPTLEGIAEVLADDGQITQVLISLVANARAAMLQGGELTIGLENVIFAEPAVHPPQRAGSFVRLTVTDTGGGLPAEVVDHLHEPFPSLPFFRKRQGLDLSIAYTIVTAHGGWVEVENRPGQGCQFQVFLPANRDDRSPVAEVSAVPLGPTRASTCGTETILVVDDEAMVRWVIKAVLSYRGYRVVEAADGDEAVRKYRAEPGAFDLILLDMHMPRLDGWETLARLRQDNPATPVILLSGVQSEEQAERIAKADSVTFLSKPFENQELLRLVRKTLDARPRPR
jgi:two-component system cell cycle sensor histidine kinase/response regulator CckA